MDQDIYKPTTKAQNASKKVLIITADKCEDLEFFYPFYRLTEEGCQVDVATPEGGEVKAKHGLSLQETKRIESVKASDYDLLYLPGGKAPQQLRKMDSVLSLVKEFVKSGKPIAAVCHGPQILCTADVIKDKKITCWPEVGSEVKDAGANYVDVPCVQDGQFITSRCPGDLPAHLASTLFALGLRKNHQLQQAA